MAKLTVSDTAAVRLPSYGAGKPTIQNLGPGKLYLGDSEDVTVATGLQLAVGAQIAFSSGSSSWGPIWMIADAANTDVRVLTLG